MEPKAILNYWRRCLADSQQQSPKLDPLFQLEREWLEQGRLPAAETQQIFAEAERFKMPRRQNQPKIGGKQFRKKDEPSLIRILVAPFRLKIEVEHGQRRYGRSIGSQDHAPLWISAQLDRSGSLQGDPKHSPWVDRGYLAPAGEARLTIGELSHSDSFRSASSAPAEPLKWSSQLDYAKRLLEAVTKQDGLWQLTLPGIVSTGPVAVLADDQIQAAKHLLHLLDQLRDQPSLCSPCLVSLVGEAAEPEVAVPQTLMKEVGNRHLGHTAAAFGLQPSQRNALLAGLSLEEGQVLAIKGPPGTGKTTLIQSLVASLWVEAALEGGEPPVIHACTSNNRAFENILETFNRSLQGLEGDDSFESRWISGPSGYGLSMPSGFTATRHRERGFPLALKGFPIWQGLPTISHGRESVLQEKQSFLKSARRAFGESANQDLEAATGLLHSMLVEAQQEIREILECSARSHQARAEAQYREHRVFRAALQDQSLDRENEVANLEQMVQRVEEAISKVTFWEDLFAFLPAVRVRRADKIQAPFRDNDWNPIPRFHSSEFRDDARSLVTEALAQAKRDQDHLATLIAAEEKLEGAIARIVSLLPEQDRKGSAEEELAQQCLEDESELQQLLDRTLRRKMFHLAARYWEGRWLREVEDLHREDPSFKRRQDEASCRQRLRRFAKLTPISVSTFFMLPSLFDYYDSGAGEARPLSACCDLLLVDEAGQTLPEVGAPAFQFAKRAVVVGDRHQIEPIWGIDRALDSANQRRSGINLEGVQGDPFRCSHEGSLMLLAERASRWSDNDESAGVLLTEHWRCRPKIIEFCNRLIYGRLQAKRPESSNPHLPNFGWAHLNYPSEKRWGSWSNPGHAQAIAAWIERRKKELVNHYGGLENIGIVTPFRAQARVMQQALDRHNLRVETGTVHTFQGGEKDLIIFSPTYTGEDPAGYFFDLGPNMLNVAVSRARESFLVFGDMSIFQLPSAGEKVAVPSRLLAECLFQAAGQEVTDVQAVDEDAFSSKVRRIDTLDGHRRQLRRALEEATARILLVSPYLSSSALEADEVPNLIQQARSRGVRVVVAYCRDLQRGRQAMKPQEALLGAGAEVWSLDRVHNKSLAVDDQWLVEGSFNWLSATRDRDSQYHRAEASILCVAPEAVEMIEGAWALVERRRAAL